MGSLIRTPDELFVSEEEWFGKGIKERKAKGKKQGEGVGAEGGAKEDEAKNGGAEVAVEDRMDVDTDESAKAAAGVGVESHAKAVKEEEEEEATPAVVSKARFSEYEVEGPEELSEVLDYVAGVIMQLDRRNRVKKDVNSTELEDPLTRNLRLNLLALAKRAPLDTIARLPMDLVPEHIRHFVPTLTT